MSIREKITSILFGSKEEPPVQEEGGGSLQPEPQEEAAPESSPFPAEEPALIKLTAEHPLQQLYTIRRRERGGLPAPRLCLDEEGALPPEVVKKEKSRLQGAVRTAAAFRLKSVQNQNKNAEKARQKKAAKGEDGEDPEKKPAGMDAHPWIFLSADKLFAWVMVFPPTGQGRELTRELLHQALEDQGIIYGLDERLADRLAHDEERYFHLFLIAQGKPAFDGKNGNIVDYVPRVVERVLQVDEYDQVDYTALNLIHNVKEGQEICRLIRPTEGDPGRTVLDQEIPAKSGKEVPLPKGRNTEISEDGLSLLYSMGFKHMLCVSSQANALDGLLEQKADIFIGSNESANYILNQSDQSDSFETVYSMVSTIRYAVLVNKSSASVYRNLNRALEDIHANGIYEEIHNSWVTNPFEKQIEAILRCFFISLAVFACFTLAFLGVSYVLKQKINEKKLSFPFSIKCSLLILNKLQ